MEKEVIHVGLYGGKSIFGGRETPLEASIISCGMKDQCSLYAQGQCAAIRSFGSNGCKHGQETVKKGYTSRAQKYHKFRSEWRNHEKYGALESNTKKLAIIGEEIFFSYSYITLKVDENGNVDIGGPSFGFGSDVAYIPKEKFTTELIKRICDYRPQAIMGGKIKAYQDEQVPLFLGHLKEIIPNLYDEFVKEYPQYDKKIDYVGRKALLHSLEPCLITEEHSRFSDTIWEWDGEHLNYKSGYIPRSFIIPHGIEGDVEDIKIKPKESSVIKISSNEQVTENTKLID